MYCSRCGSNLPEGAIFCSACGQRAGAPVPAPGTGPSDTVSTPLPWPAGAGSGPAAGASAAAPAGPAIAPGYGYPAPAAARHPYAGFWLRVVAYIIDALIVGFAVRLITLPFWGMWAWRMMVHPPSNFADLFPMMGAMFHLFLFQFVANWLYYALLESSAWQATIGKKILGLYVSDMNGQRIGFGRATGRYFGMIVSSLILCIGYIMAGFTEKKQALHDMMAGCLVLRKL